MKASGFSLWLMPKGKAYQILHETIDSLSKKYSAPIFDPHLTLLANIELPKKEIIARVEKITKNFKFFIINCEGVDFEDYYFRSLYLKVGLSRELAHLHQEIKQTFNIENKSDYMPHISLLYGDYSVSTKQEIIQALEKHLTNIEFLAEGVSVFQTFGQADEWVKVEDILFKE